MSCLAGAGEPRQLCRMLTDGYVRCAALAEKAEMDKVRTCSGANTAWWRDWKIGGWWCAYTPSWRWLKIQATQPACRQG